MQALPTVAKVAMRPAMKSPAAGGLDPFDKLLFTDLVGSGSPGGGSRVEVTELTAVVG